MIHWQERSQLRLLIGTTVFLSILALAGQTALGQGAQGALSGNVTDKSDSLIPQATVLVTNEQTGAEVRLVTTSVGHFFLPNLLPGSYRVTISKTGFKTAVRTGVVAAVGSTTALNVSLVLGAVNETVSVRADALSLSTESSEVGTVVTPQEVNALPLSVGSGGMRNAQDFIFLTPGTYGIGTAGGDYFFTIGGGQQFGSLTLIDGLPVEALDNGDGITGGALPSLEALEEFKVITAGLPAEYGTTTGGVETYATKSGTNTFHGSVYDIFRNTALDANSWFNNGYAALYPENAQSYRRPPDTKNEYGLTIGGPLRIPKVYNGTNKTFFFFSWEQFQQNYGVVLPQTVPTAAMRNGDFSATLTNTVLGINPCNNQPIYQGQIFDPQTTKTVGGQLCRDPFQNNQIPSFRFSKVATNLLNLYPNPTNSQQTLNYVFATSYPVKDTSYTIRIDHQFSPADTIFGSYTLRYHDNPYGGNTPSLPAPVDPTGASQDLGFNHLRLGYDHAFSPDTYNSFRLGWTHEGNLLSDQAYKTGKNWDALLGITGLGGTGKQNFPSFIFGESITSAGGSGSCNGCSTLYLTKGDSYAAIDSLVFVRGKHSITVGGEATVAKEGINSNGSTSGIFSFARTQTAATQTTELNSGNGFASFLLGDTDVSQVYNQLSIPQSVTQYGAIFIQDQYKVAKTLSLSLGLRWDVSVPYRNATHNYAANFDPTLPNAGAGDLPGSLIFAGAGMPGLSGLSSRFADTWYKDLGPRIGAAWAPEALNSKVVFRAFYGIQYAPLILNTGAYPGPGYTANSYLQDFDTGGFGTGFNLDTPYPSFPQTVNLDPTQLNNQPVTYVSRGEGRPGMVQIRSLEIQQELTSDLIFTLGYLGSHGTHLRSGDLQQLNGLNPKYYGMGNTLNETVDGIDFPSPYPGFYGTVAQALRPFPQYLAVQQYQSGNIGSSYYDSLYAKLERRFRSGLSLLASYTWSKALNIGADSIQPGVSESYSGIQNPFDLSQEKALAQNDVPQMFVISYVYQLPLGRNKRFLNHGGLVNALIGGWQVSGINRYMSGQPAGILGGCATSIPGLDTCIRNNRVLGQPFYSSAWTSGHFNPYTETALNPAAFSDPNANVASGGGYSFGNLPRVSGDVRGGAYLNEDVSLEKVVPFYRTRNISFRLDAFNVFNRHVFALPDTTVTDPTFGQVSGLMNSPRQVQATLHIQF